MKKPTIIFSLFKLLCLTLVAQDSAYLDIGNVRALVYSDGNLFQNRASSAASFEVPKGSNAFSIYASSFWMTSESIRNNRTYYATAYEKYGFENLFNIGPVDIVNQLKDSSASFQRLWSITQQEIINHIQNWNTPGYITPASILDWPGNGNNNTAQNLAPYEDLDGDNIYEPQDGEYPIIKGDQAIFLMLNDYRINRECLIVDPNNNDTICNYVEGSLKLEMHVMLYAYNSPIQSVANSVFVNVKLFNRSNSSIDDHNDFRFSVFTDFDLGYGADDFVGTDTTRNLQFVYNGDFDDEDARGNSGYGNRLAAQGVHFFRKKLSHSRYFQIGVGPAGDPQTATDYVGMQRGKWRNGRNMHYGGDGFFIFNACADTTQKTQFAYTGPYNSLVPMPQWTEFNVCPNGGMAPPNPPGDRRMIGGPEIPEQFYHGDTLEIDYAYIFARDNDSSVSLEEPIALLALATDTVANFFDSVIVVSNREVSLSSTPLQFEAFPNPVNNELSIKTDIKNYEIHIIDIRGQIITQYNNEKELNLSRLSNGLYFVRLFNETHSGIKRIVVMH